MSKTYRNLTIKPITPERASQVQEELGRWWAHFKLSAESLGQRVEEVDIPGTEFNSRIYSILLMTSSGQLFGSVLAIPCDGRLIVPPDGEIIECDETPEPHYHTNIMSASGTPVPGQDKVVHQSIGSIRIAAMGALAFYQMEALETLKNGGAAPRDYLEEKYPLPSLAASSKKELMN